MKNTLNKLEKVGTLINNTGSTVSGIATILKDHSDSQNMLTKAFKTIEEGFRKMALVFEKRNEHIKALTKTNKY